jgi:DNA polymerase III subunit epsilon
MLILGLDIETTGLEKESSAVTEVGMCIWDTEYNMPTQLVNFLVKVPKDIVWTQWILNNQGLTPELCEREGYEPERAVKLILLWMTRADAVCTHNGKAFDIPFITYWASNLGYELPDKPHLDTRFDLDSQMPEHFSRKLPYMACDHQIVTPYSHRALFDVITMLRILSLYDLDEALLMARTPSVQLIAEVSFDQKDLAKARGFYWKGEKKLWMKDIKECFIEKEAALANEVGFTVRVVRGA